MPTTKEAPEIDTASNTHSWFCRLLTRITGKTYYIKRVILYPEGWKCETCGRYFSDRRV